MARKGQDIGVVEGLQGGFGGEDFLRELVQRAKNLMATLTPVLSASANQTSP